MLAYDFEQTFLFFLGFGFLALGTGTEDRFSLGKKFPFPKVDLLGTDFELLGQFLGSLPLFKGLQNHFGLEFRGKLSSCHISKFKFIFELNLLS